MQLKVIALSLILQGTLSVCAGNLPSHLVDGALIALTAIHQSRQIEIRAFLLHYVETQTNASYQLNIINQNMPAEMSEEASGAFNRKLETIPGLTIKALYSLNLQVGGMGQETITRKQEAGPGKPYKTLVMDLVANPVAKDPTFTKLDMHFSLTENTPMCFGTCENRVEHTLAFSHEFSPVTGTVCSRINPERSLALFVEARKIL